MSYGYVQPQQYYNGQMAVPDTHFIQSLATILRNIAIQNGEPAQVIDMLLHDYMAPNSDLQHTVLSVVYSAFPEARNGVQIHPQALHDVLRHRVQQMCMMIKQHLASQMQMQQHRQMAHGGNQMYSNHGQVGYGGSSAAPRYGNGGGQQNSQAGAGYGGGGTAPAPVENVAAPTPTQKASAPMNNLQSPLHLAQTRDDIDTSGPIRSVNHFYDPDQIAKFSVSGIVLAHPQASEYDALRTVMKGMPDETKRGTYVYVVQYDELMVYDVGHASFVEMRNTIVDSMKQSGRNWSIRELFANTKEFTQGKYAFWEKAIANDVQYLTDRRLRLQSNVTDKLTGSWDDNDLIGIIENSIDGITLLQHSRAQSVTRRIQNTVLNNLTITSDDKSIANIADIQNNPDNLIRADLDYYDKSKEHVSKYSIAKFDVSERNALLNEILKKYTVIARPKTILISNDSDDKFYSIISAIPQVLKPALVDATSMIHVQKRGNSTQTTSYGVVNFMDANDDLAMALDVTLSAGPSSIT